MARYRSLLAVTAACVSLVGGLSGTASAVGTCSTDNSFCITYALSVRDAGTSTTATTAAAPVDASVTLQNTSPNRVSDTNLWLDHLDVSLLSGLGGNVVTPSATLDNNLLIAGSDTQCGSDPNFTACPGGSGDVDVQFNGNVYQGTFGVQGVRNINPPAPGYAVDWSLTIRVCVNPGIPLCQNTTSEIQGNPAVDGTFSIPTSTTISSNGFSGLASIYAATINISGIASKVSTNSGDVDAPSGAQTVFHLPTQCGDANASGTAVSHGSATASVTAALPVSGCPTAHVGAAEQLLRASFDGTGSSTPVSGRTLKLWHWSFGDGSRKVTAGPKVAHTYSASGDRTVRLVVEDSLGALSRPVSLLLRGSAMTWAASASRVRPGTAVTLSGRLTRWHTSTGLGGRAVRIERCKVGTTRCTLVKTVTTSRHAGRVGRFAVVVHPTSAGDYRATFAGGQGYLGIRKVHRITLR
jgi:hypothetical protein